MTMAQELEGAASTGSAALVREILLRHGREGAEADGFLQDALARTAYEGRALAVANLLEAGVKPSVPDRLGQTPLHWAARRGHEEVARKLLEHGALVSERSQDGATPLHLAAEGDSAALVQLLLARRAEVAAETHAGRTALHAAAEGGSTAALAILLEDPASLASLESANKRGEAPLVCAAARGHAAVIESLLCARAEPDRRDQWGQAALHRAAAGGHVSATRLLICLGRADVNATERDGATALHTAAERGHMQVLDQLLANGADPSARTSNGRTALHAASERGRLDVVSALLLGRADANARTDEARSVLACAAGRGHAAVMQQLLEHGANPWAADSIGQTPLHAAAVSGDAEAVGILVAKGARLDDKDVQGRTPAAAAAACHQEAALRQLLRCGSVVPESAMAIPAMAALVSELEHEMQIEREQQQEMEWQWEQAELREYELQAECEPQQETGHSGGAICDATSSSPSKMHSHLSPWDDDDQSDAGLPPRPVRDDTTKWEHETEVLVAASRSDQPSSAASGSASYRDCGDIVVATDAISEGERNNGTEPAAFAPHSARSSSAVGGNRPSCVGSGCRCATIDTTEEHRLLHKLPSVATWFGRLPLPRAAFEDGNVAGRLAKFYALRNGSARQARAVVLSAIERGAPLLSIGRVTVEEEALAWENFQAMPLEAASSEEIKLDRVRADMASSHGCPITSGPPTIYGPGGVAGTVWENQRWSEASSGPGGCASTGIWNTGTTMSSPVGSSAGLEGQPPGDGDRVEVLGTMPQGLPSLTEAAANLAAQARSLDELGELWKQLLAAGDELGAAEAAEQAAAPLLEENRECQGTASVSPPACLRDGFLSFLLGKGNDNIAIAWRRHFDTDGDDRVDFLEFSDKLNTLGGYSGDVLQLWHALAGNDQAATVTGQGPMARSYLSLEVLDPDNAMLLDIFGRWCANLGGPSKLFSALDKEGRRWVQAPDFVGGLRELGLYEEPGLPVALRSEERFLACLYPLIDQWCRGGVSEESLFFLEKDPERRRQLRRDVARAARACEKGGPVRSAATHLLGNLARKSTRLGRQDWKRAEKNLDRHLGPPPDLPDAATLAALEAQARRDRERARQAAFRRGGHHCSVSTPDLHNGAGLGVPPRSLEVEGDNGTERCSSEASAKRALSSKLPVLGLGGRRASGGDIEAGDTEVREMTPGRQRQNMRRLYNQQLASQLPSIKATLQTGKPRPPVALPVLGVGATKGIGRRQLDTALGPRCEDFLSAGSSRGLFEHYYNRMG